MAGTFRDSYSTPTIHYIVCDVPQLAGEGLLYHLLTQSDFLHLRSFMTLLSLPSDVTELSPDNPPFTTALKRSMVAPALYRSPASDDWSKANWDALYSTPFLIVFLASAIPEWLLKLLQQKHVGILTQHEDILKEGRKFSKAHVGLMRGTKDLKEAYRILSELIHFRLCNGDLSQDEKIVLQKLESIDIFTDRPRLRFLPPIPLPQDLTWRPAAYILNRISNNVDEPGVEPPGSAASVFNETIFDLLAICRMSCGLFALLEKGLEIPAILTESEKQLVSNAYLKIKDETDTQKALGDFVELGAALIKGRHFPMSLGVPSGRIDLIKKDVPTSLKLKGPIKKYKEIFSSAISDHMRNYTQRKFIDSEKQTAYDTARETIIGAHRLMSAQLAYLSLGVGALPLLAPEVGAKLYTSVKNFYDALEMKSKKRKFMFQRLEMNLADALPDGIVQRLAVIGKSVMIYSDLPFEWTLLPDGWPICLTKPVYRIPVAASRAWSNLATLGKRGVSINVRKPDRVLVLDLIPDADPIKQSSILFRQVSDSMGQQYTYKVDPTLNEIKEVLSAKRFDIVVLDTHGQYIKAKDDLLLLVKGAPIRLQEFLPNEMVPPIWILSTCETSVVGSITGGLVRELFEHGALAVVGTLHKIDAEVASLFVGKLLTEIFSPPPSRSFDTFLEAFFNAQLTTAVLYDPLLPLIRKLHDDPIKSHLVVRVLEDYLTSSKPGTSKEFRINAAVLLDQLLQKYRLRETHQQLQDAGMIVPETLLYSVFGLPGSVRLVKNDDRPANSPEPSY